MYSATHYSLKGALGRFSTVSPTEIFVRCLSTAILFLCVLATYKLCIFFKAFNMLMLIPNVFCLSGMFYSYLHKSMYIPTCLSLIGAVTGLLIPSLLANEPFMKEFNGWIPF